MSMVMYYFKPFAWFEISQRHQPELLTRPGVFDRRVIRNRIHKGDAPVLGIIWNYKLYVAINLPA